MTPARPAPAPRGGTPSEAGYDASAIEVLEGLEPVRRRPGMYIGGTDERALHHLFAEVIDNAMDEAVAGHASFIDVELFADGSLAVIKQLHERAVLRNSSQQIAHLILFLLFQRVVKIVELFSRGG